MRSLTLLTQSQSYFSSKHSKKDFFEAAEEFKNSISFSQQNQISKVKIPKINHHQARNIFLQLNQKNSHKSSLQKKNWKTQQACLLVYLVNVFCFFEKIQIPNDLSMELWQEISSFLPGRSVKDCKFKLLSLTASTITNIPWSIEERNILSEIVQQHGMKWNIVSQILYEKSDKKVYRTSKQCREHYMCFLRPNLKKGPWTQQQDYKLVCLFLQHGRKWSRIMKQIQDRNENSIKNRFFLLFESKVKTSNQLQLVRKVKRKKQRMEKNMKKNISQLNFPVHQTLQSDFIHGKNYDENLDVQMEMEKNQQSQTKKNDDINFDQQWLKQTKNEDPFVQNMNSQFMVKNEHYINDFHLYERTEMENYQINEKNSQFLNGFQSFEQYISL